MNPFIKSLAPPFRVVKQNDTPLSPDFSPNTLIRFAISFHKNRDIYKKMAGKYFLLPLDK